MTTNGIHTENGSEGASTARRPTELDRTIGRRIRRFRRFVKVTQARAARAIGVSPPQFQKYETGLNRISLSALIRLAHLFEMVPHRFLYELCEDIETERTRKNDR